MLNNPKDSQVAYLQFTPFAMTEDTCHKRSIDLAEQLVKLLGVIKDTV